VSARPAPPPRLPGEGSRLSLLVWLLLAVLVALGLWAHYSVIDQTARANATVIASSRVQVIQAVDGGVLEQLRVREGDRVKEGDVLAVFNETRARASLQEIEAKRAALRANLARLQAELGEGPAQFPADVLRYPSVVQLQEALLRERRAALAAELRSLTDVARLARDELVITERLVRSGDASQIELLRAQRLATEAAAQLANRRNKHVQEVSAEMAKAREEYEQVEQQATQRRQQVVNSVIRAPMSGVVKNVRFTTLGGVLRPGDELLQVVPVEDQMIVEAKVLPRDIALVRTGLPASIKFDAYDYTVFGAVDGEVIYVSADTMRDEGQRGEAAIYYYYRVHVRTTAPGPTTNIGRRIDVIPGMTAVVDIRTGQRSLLSYLLRPVTKTFAEAFRER
jgi:adhesin transport system membrane fusion protein